MITVVLVCAVCAALAGGVLLAYSLCFGIFQILRIHSMQVVQQRAQRTAVKAIANANLTTG